MQQNFYSVVYSDLNGSAFVPLSELLIPWGNFITTMLISKRIVINFDYVMVECTASLILMLPLAAQ